MDADLKSFQEFIKRREEAGSAYVCGDAAPLGKIVTHDLPATFFGPQGGSQHGADDVWRNMSMTLQCLRKAATP